MTALNTISSDDLPFVGWVVSDTEPVFFFLWEFCLFFPRARVGLVKKSDEKHRKKSTLPKFQLFG